VEFLDKDPRRRSFSPQSFIALPFCASINGSLRAIANEIGPSLFVFLTKLLVLGEANDSVGVSDDWNAQMDSRSGGNIIIISSDIF